MILPLFTYCSIVTCHKSNTNNLKIQSLESRAKSIILNGKPVALSIWSIQDVLKKRICEFVYKCLKNDVCEDFQNYFDLMRNNTRNKDILIRISSIKLECTKKSFYFTGASLFNSLPAPQRRADTFLEFSNYFSK